MFHKCESEAEIKKLFRKTSQFVHPDLGGDSEVMSLLIECKDKAIDSLGSPKRWEPNENKSRNKWDPEEKPPWKKKGYKKKETPESERIYEEDEELDFLNVMQFYIDEHPKFDSGFHDSVKAQLIKRGWMSEAQCKGLYKVYKAFEMEEYYENNT